MTGVIVWTISDIIWIALAILIVIFFLFIALSSKVVDLFISFGEWILRRNSKEEKEDDNETSSDI